MAKIEGQTNVLSSRFGAGSVDGLGNEVGTFVVATMDVPWDLARERIGGTPAEVLLADSMEFDVVDAQVASAPDCDTVVAVGGGRAIDLGKYFAWKRGCRLVSVPTILSVDAFVTPAAGLRRDRRVEYVGTASPDPLVIDYDLLRTAPPALNIAGVGDLLSIHTAAFDWEIAEKSGVSEYEFSAQAVQDARAILTRIEAQADEIRVVSDAGLRTIVEEYMQLNTICLPRDHYRVEEGSEHFLFYALEEALGIPFVHGFIIGMGVAIMSRLQNNHPDEVIQLMQRLELPFQPVDMELAREPVIEALMSLQEFVTERKLWYSVINEKPIDRALAEELIDGLQFAN